MPSTSQGGDECCLRSLVTSRVDKPGAVAARHGIPVTCRPSQARRASTPFEDEQMSRDAAESAGLPRSEEHRREVSPILGRAVEWLSLHVSTKAVAATAGLLLFAVAGIVLYLILENTSWAATEAAVSRTAWS